MNSTYDVQSDNLSAGLLDLLQLSKVVPVSGLGDNIVGRKDPHSAVPLISFLVPLYPHNHSLELGVLVRLRWELSPNDRVLGESGHLIISIDVLLIPSSTTIQSILQTPDLLIHIAGSEDSRDERALASQVRRVVRICRQEADIAPVCLPRLLFPFLLVPFLILHSGLLMLWTGCEDGC
jgi:hypothetical protein